MIPRKRLHPGLILVGAPRQDLFADYRLTHYIAEKVCHLAWSRKPRQVSMNDNPVKTVVNKYQQASKKACEQLHRSAPLDFCLSNKIIGQPTAGVKISNIFG